MKRTIVAVSTPNGNGAIGIVRMSGEKALDFALNFFSAKNLTKQNIQPRKMYLGDFKGKNIFDKCLMVYFKAPFSFTGEDLVEFHLHGGRFLCEEVLKELVSLEGCSLAENGEFSKIAFMNGKISLDKAEGIIDLIEAESQEEIKAGYELVKGKLFKQVKQMQERLQTQIAHLEMTIDYPEHDYEESAKQDVLTLSNQIKSQIVELLENSKNGQLVKNGVNVALVGKTNAGKSSLLNALVGEDIAIVTDIEGTTRDTIKQTYNYKGVKFNFIDTAGLRQSVDIVEKIGIERSKQAMQNADIVLFVVDGSKNNDEKDNELFESIKKLRHIVVLNKSDLETKNSVFDNFVAVSCVSGEGIENLKQQIYNMTISSGIDSSKIMITNQRHISALKESLQIFSQIENLENISCDIIAFELKRIWQTLGKITGVSENETIIDEIFSRFCLGK